jgi:hypothetical protein
MGVFAIPASPYKERNSVIPTTMTDIKKKTFIFNVTRGDPTSTTRNSLSETNGIAISS